MVKLELNQLLSVVNTDALPNELFTLVSTFCCTSKLRRMGGMPRVERGCLYVPTIGSKRSECENGFCQVHILVGSVPNIPHEARQSGRY